MPDDNGRDPHHTDARRNSFQPAPPAVALPKGGGAIRGISEKFAANPVTGTASLSIPIAVSPGRSGFGPQLALSYDSGAGNGPFGFGWNLALPSITRKTDKGLPTYQDADHSDVFMLSGAEDLVPKLEEHGSDWQPYRLEHYLNGRPYRVELFRPRVEGLFARIERWTNPADAADVFWRSISRDNVTTWYGKVAESRIFDPADPTHIFSWLISESHDDKGNLIAYGYKAENSQQVPASLSEANRSDEFRRANRYLKRICYGNRTPYVPDLVATTPALPPADWLFEVVFDYGEHHAETPHPREEAYLWSVRKDPFSVYRAAFEVRTYRLCRRVLMFHHVPEDAEVGSNCLVRATSLAYREPQDPAESAQPGFTQLISIGQHAYQRRLDGSYHSRQFPPVTFRYSEPWIDLTLQSIDASHLDGLPVGTQGSGYQWIDIEGGGLPGVLSEQFGAWFYASNLGGGRFTESRCLSEQPMPAMHAPGAMQLVDLDSDGRLELVSMQDRMPGFYVHDDEGRWRDFIPFVSFPNIRWDDPNLRWLDLTGDGHADVLVTEQEVYAWYPGEARRGYGGVQQVRWRHDEEHNPRCVFADGTQTIFLADMCGDGLVDLVRIRNGEVCYWPNRGYGHFGAKVTLDNAPQFDAPDLYDPRRIRLADIDGSGPSDLIYLGRDGAHLYYNRSGNSLSHPVTVDLPLATENLAAVQVADLLGSGTACLVWNSHLPADAARPVRYIDLMSQGKPHLLIEIRNNLGGHTQIEYAPSTRFYIQDKLAGTPWITRLPFPVHCVSKVTVRDQWRGTAFSSTYSYHHGYYDGIEREFRGFGRVEQVDVEDYGQFEAANSGSPWITDDQRLYQPPVKTVTWFHTGAAIDRRRILAQFAEEYFPSRYRFDDGFRERALPEPLLAKELDADEWREALRACKGMMLRQEIYELDIDALTGAVQQHRPIRIFSAATHNCRIQRLQPRGPNRHAVFLVTESEAVIYQYEQPLPELGGVVRPDPRIAHMLTLRVDELGQPLQTVAVGYPRVRRHDNPMLDETAINRIRSVQNERHLAYSETRYTADIVMPGSTESGAAILHHRLRLPYQVLTFELTGVAPAESFYFQPRDFAALRLSDQYPPVDESASPIDVALLPYHRLPERTILQRRLVEHVRTLYFDDGDDTSAPLGALPPGRHGPRGLKYEDYKLALTEELAGAVFQAPAMGPDVPADLLAWELRSGLTARELLNDPQLSGYQPDGSGNYWIRSGIAGFAEDAARHFFLPERYTDPFGAVTTLEYDPLDLYVQSVTDARRNRVEVLRFDHRVLTPVEMVDPNGNHTEACVDILGRVMAVAAKGKRTGSGWEGDDLDAFSPDSLLRNPSTADVQAFSTASTLDESQARRWLGRASSRFVYHFGEARDAEGNVIAWGARPAMACAIAREVHASQPGGERSLLQIALECSDGSGNVLMKKVQAEPEVEGGALRWIVNGLTVLNNKGKPVKQYEPFFSDRFGCEMPLAEGVTPILFYDAAGRVVCANLPDGTFTKVEFSPWHSVQFDAGDTVLDSAWYAGRGSPDPAVPLPRGVDGAVTVEPDVRAAWLAAKLANTPEQTHVDSLGRPAITIAHNRIPDETARPAIEWSVADWGWKDDYHLNHTKLDVEGKPLWVRDARGNLVMQYLHPPKPDSDLSDDIPPASVPTYDIAGNLLFQHSMDAGDRWSLTDAAGQPFLAWDVNEVLDAEGQKHPEARLAHTEYDRLHRPLQQWLRLGSAPAAVVERFEYRDQADADADALARNLIGQAVVHDDPGGRMEVLRKSFTGLVQEERRRMARQNTSWVIDWQGDERVRTAQLEGDTFTRLTEHDALGRMTRLVNWHRNTDRVAIYGPTYNRRGLLEAEDLTVGGRRNDGAPAAGKTWRAVHGIAYNAKGQRIRMQYDNGTETRYDYDPRTFRLTQLRTTRPATDLPFPDYRSNLSDDRVVQQLHYTYDAAGNIAEIEDETWVPVFFRNQQVEPRSLYVYDGIGRLIEATGRERARLTTAPEPISEALVVDRFPSDEMLRNYRQRYDYDVVGNFIAMRHQADGGSWTRHYETAVSSNRLLRTWTGGDDLGAVRYGYDMHGSMLNLANVPDRSRIRWDWRDMIDSMDLGGGGRVAYAYDIGKQRTRKRIERIDGAVEERLYLGGMELYRRYAPSGALVEEIETQHLFVDDQRVLLVDDVIATDHPVLGTGVFMRYQYGNHLGSIALELDETAQIVGCEEFHPYGTTAYHLVNHAVRATAKRYRYTGMERDEESGLNYHTERYYMPWLGRWESADPIGISDGFNLYRSLSNNPILFTDTSGTQADAGVPLPAGIVRPEEDSPVPLPSDVPAPIPVSPPAPPPLPEIIIVLLTGYDYAVTTGDHDTDTSIPEDTTHRIGHSIEEIAGSDRTALRIVNSPLDDEDEVRRSADFVRHALELNPEARVIIYGHSRGGHSAIDLSRELSSDGTGVDLLITTDAAMSDASDLMDQSIPENVAVHLNWYQTNRSDPSYHSHGAPHHPLIGSGTRVFNRHVDIAHVGVDEYAEEEVVQRVRAFIDSGVHGEDWLWIDLGPDWSRGAPIPRRDPIHTPSIMRYMGIFSYFLPIPHTHDGEVHY